MCKWAEGSKGAALPDDTTSVLETARQAECLLFTDHLWQQHWQTAGTVSVPRVSC